MKKKYIWGSVLAAAVMIILIFGGIRFFSTNSRNTRILEQRLCKAENNEEGQVSKLLTIDYDTLYVFAPYENRDRMEDRIGFRTGVLEESSSEGCINYLFVKDGKAAGYLYGLPEKTGYCINLQPGEYSREELDKMAYEVKTRSVGNSFGKEKSYQDYNFYYPDELESGKDKVVVQSTNAITEVPVGEEITVDLDGSGVQTVRYCVDIETDESGLEIGAQIKAFWIGEKDFTKELSNLGVLLENPGTDCFYIVDLDASDSYKEIALFDQGPSDDPETYFLRYQNGGLKLLGSVTDNPASDTCHFQNDSQNAGEIVASFRLSILQTWYAEGYWKLNSGGKLQFEEQSVYYPIGTYEAELLCELPVYHMPDREGEFFIVKPGKVTFTATDNKNWVQLETKDGSTGWFYVENYDTIADIGQNAQEVFASLIICD